MKTLGVIPARYGSKRLEGKPLADICGKTMIERVYDQVKRAKSIDRIIVATDDDRIIQAVHAFGGEAVMTSRTHPTGSDRVEEAARPIDCDIVINIQGDEPLILPQIIDETVYAAYDRDVLLATAAYKLQDTALYDDPNVVKAVADQNGRALYFSRSLIPHHAKGEPVDVYEHIGVYAFKKAFLQTFVQLQETPLAKIESLEQLKVLEHGYPIQLVFTQNEYTAVSVDDENDLEAVRRIFLERQSSNTEP